MRQLLFVALLSLGCGGENVPRDAGGDGGGNTDAGEWPALGECIDFMGRHTDFDMSSGSAGDVSYRLWRCERERGVGLSWGWHGEAFELVTAAQTYRADAAAITYHLTLHNAQDDLEATVPGATLRWRQSRALTSPDVVRYYVSATDSAGGTLLIETEVH